MSEFENGYIKGYYAGAEDIRQDHKEELEAVCKKFYKEGYDDAAGNYKAWYLLDKNENPMHIGDKVKTSSGILTITGISVDVEPMNCLVMAGDDNGGWQFKPWCIEKVAPDTREKIIEDIATAIYDPVNQGIREHPAYIDCKRYAARIVSRIEELKGE